MGSQAFVLWPMSWPLRQDKLTFFQTVISRGGLPFGVQQSQPSLRSPEADVFHLIWEEDMIAPKCFLNGAGETLAVRLGLYHTPN